MASSFLQSLKFLKPLSANNPIIPPIFFKAILAFELLIGSMIIAKTVLITKRIAERYKLQAIIYAKK